MLLLMGLAGTAVMAVLVLKERQVRNKCHSCTLLLVCMHIDGGNAVAADEALEARDLRRPPPGLRS